MNSKIFLLLFVFATQFLFSQETNPTITLEFSNQSTKTVLDKIETLSNYRFYYDEKWLPKNLISGNYEGKSIEYILDKIAENTELNFFIDQEKIILTKNKMIYKSLPKNYFTKSGDENTASNKPILNDIDALKSGNLTFIGKETLNNTEDTYTLTGNLKNLKNGLPLNDVIVSNKSNKKTTVSDADGNYSIQANYGENTIEFEGQGMQKQTRKIIVYNNGQLDVALSEKINLLNEIVVKGKRRNNIRAAITGVTTIEAEGVKTVPLVLGERDVLKVALTIPGIKTAGEGSAGFNVRGGKEDQNLILLDNATIYNPAHFLGFFSAINPYATNRVDIYKGGIPVQFGGRLSSVFDIISKNGSTEKVKGEAGIGPVTSNITVSTPIVKNKSSLLIGARGTYSGWILKTLKEEKLKNSQASFYDVITKYRHEFNKKNSVEGTFYYSKDKFSITSDSLFNYSNSLLSIKYNRTINDKHKGEFNFTNSTYKFGIDYENSIKATNSFRFGYQINETQGVLKMNYTLNPKNRITYGISGKLYKINPGTIHPTSSISLISSLDIADEKGLETALFVSNNYKISEKLLIDYGVRFSIFTALGPSIQKTYLEDKPLSEATVTEEKVFGNNDKIKRFSGFEPRISAKYSITDNLSIKAGYDKTYQYIHLLSTNTTQSPTDTWKLSDLNIDPQSGQQFSFGIFKSFNNSDLEASVEGYYKKSKNILDYKVGANIVLNQNLETELLQGEGKSYGVEFLLKKTDGKLNGWLGYTYSRAFIKLNSPFKEEMVNKGEYFPTNFDKPHDFSAVLNYKFTKRYSLSSNFTYQTGRPITYPVGKFVFGGADYTLYSDRNKFRIPDYYRLDIGINIEGNHKIKKLAHSFWNISVYNVLGRNNPYSVYFVTEKGKIKGYETSIFGIPVPTITYNFKF